MSDWGGPKSPAMLDSYGPPTRDQRAAARRAGVRTWGAYLNSPGHPSGWGTPAIDALIEDGIGAIPIYLTPLTAADRLAYRATACADAAVHQVKALTGEGNAICLDTEREAAYNGDHLAEDCLEWIGDFWERIHTAHPTFGAHSSGYQNPSVAEAIYRLGVLRRPSAAWLAYWLEPVPTEAPDDLAVIPGLPDHMWKGRRAWQWHGPATFDGLGVDLSVHQLGFPSRVKTKTPAAPPTPPDPPPASGLTVTVNGATIKDVALPLEIKVTK